MTVYKVVRVIKEDDDIKYISSYYSGYAIIKYRINEIAKPLFGKIFCFEDIDNAKTYLKKIQKNQTYYEFTLFKCSTHSAEPIKHIPGIHSTKLKTFWKSGLDVHYLMSAPKGTYVCDSIKLIKEIK